MREFGGVKEGMRLGSVGGRGMKKFRELGALVKVWMRGAMDGWMEEREVGANARR